jgi:putative transposase
MMRPSREPFRQSEQTYFVSFQTAQRRDFFSRERWVVLLLETLQNYQSQFDLHDFVIMPDHVHLLMSPHVPLEKAVQLIKGGYSFRAKRAFEWKFDVWQVGFSDHRIRDEHDWLEHLGYIEKNVTSLRQEMYRFCGRNSGLVMASTPLWLKPPPQERS